MLLFPKYLISRFFHELKEVGVIEDKYTYPQAFDALIVPPIGSCKRLYQEVTPCKLLLKSTIWYPSSLLLMMFADASGISTHISNMGKTFNRCPPNDWVSTKSAKNHLKIFINDCLIG